MQKLDPKAVWIFFVRFLSYSLILSLWLTGMISGIIFQIIFKPIPGTEISPFSLLITIFFVFIFVIFFFIVFCWIWAKLTYRFWCYQLTEDAFKKEHGVIWKKYVSIPYERIQNVDIYRGVLARILGLSDLQIQTAGASAVVYGRRMTGVGAEGRLPGLNKQVAEQLREELIQRAKGAKQGL